MWWVMVYLCDIWKLYCVLYSTTSGVLCQFSTDCCKFFCIVVWQKFVKITIDVVLLVICLIFPSPFVSNLACPLCTCQNFLYHPDTMPATHNIYACWTYWNWVHGILGPKKSSPCVPWPQIYYVLARTLVFGCHKPATQFQGLECWDKSHYLLNLYYRCVLKIISSYFTKHYSIFILHS